MLHTMNVELSFCPNIINTGLCQINVFNDLTAELMTQNHRGVVSKSILVNVQVSAAYSAMGNFQHHLAIRTFRIW